MRDHRAVWASAATTAALLASLTTAGVADADEPLAEPLPPSRAKVAKTGSSERVGATLAQAHGPVTAFVELAATPAAEAATTERSRGGDPAQAARASRQRTDDTATRVLDVLRGKDAASRQVARTTNAVAGLVVTADAAKVRELTALPEVRTVRLSVPKVVQNAGAVQLTKAAQVWRQTGRYGEGMRIGIVDTGIDYTHADFGGPGTPAAYDAVDRTAAWTPTAKVVGGYDFVGDDYDANHSGKSTPAPDPNPIDCLSHGTHVAGSAAGYGENADGSTFTGDYRTLTDEQLTRMKIGPGSAPKASLYALKVFGCRGATNVVAQALDWALDPNGDGDFGDHLDVVNLSLGADFGAPDDPDSLFVRKLVEHGVLVVASAGNGGDFYDVGGSPANTPEALAVANTRDAFAILDGVTVPGAGDLPGQYSQNFKGYDALDLTAPVVSLADPANLDGCDPVSEDLKGKFVWLEWDDDDSTRRCGSGGRTDNAEAAGAAGAFLTSTKDNFSAAIAGNAAIPVFQFTRAVTAQLRPALTAGTLQLTMTGRLRNTVPSNTPQLADTITPSSSRGARGAIAAKPDVAAPGDTIMSADVGTGTGGASKGGTSMSAPHVAGIGALVREAHPDWTVEEVKAAVMNTAGGDVKSGDDNTTGLPEAPMRVGAGRVDALSALDTELLAMVEDDPGSVGVSFGPVEAARVLWREKRVKVVNKGGTDRSVDVSYQATTTVPGARFEVWPNAVHVRAGRTAEVRVKLVVSPDELRKVADPTVVKQQQDVARQFLAEASGLVLLKDGAKTYRVPVYAAPKPVADIEAGAASFRRDEVASVRLHGRSLDQGSGDQAYRSLISAFELQGTSGQLPDCTDDVETDCAVNESAKGGDLRYVGAASTAPVDKSDGALLAFGVVTWRNWATLGGSATPEIRIDTTGDGKPDYRVRAIKQLDANGSVIADVWLARTVRLADDEVVDEQPLNGQFGEVDTNLMDSNVVVLPVTLKALGIDPTAASFRLSYTADTAGAYPAPGNQDGFVDKIDTPMSFDPLKPGYSVRAGDTAALSYVVRSGTRLDVHRDQESLVANKSDGLLLLHHHNGTEKRAEVVKPRG
ncbi:subtilisin family serine protease [Saccharothrix tamanrassetensis]|uniref:Subtilisin family serine protease n=1 Tax=Saccharothrix tamanrassetensis TaxID=1051531 RepID=A0A841CM24_9PSEU|nr:S8 family serine peptidase [Saccharothrix tamanrassetensis]MBB5956616.1 subtilisin family serine protease [Saccharothrix tamanrassetensis]